MKKTFLNADGKPILEAMVKGIQENKDYLGTIDGLIGDGDHGMNMNKGFTMFWDQFGEEEIGFTDGIFELGNVLFAQIGGSMGPIYGSLFMGMSDAGEGVEEFGLPEFTAMMQGGRDELFEIIEARVGDKTLADTLIPAIDALEEAVKADRDFSEALFDMKVAAVSGRDSTLDLEAKFGRAARLGERSKGVLDAGATSCCIILTAMADSILSLLEE